MKCSRSRCGNVGANLKTGLCDSHYRHVPHGYIDASAAIERFALLKRMGLGERQIAALSGLNRDTLRLLGSWGRGNVEVDTHRKLMAVPVPDRVVDGGAAKVCAVGTRRRIQALMRAGHTQTQIGAHFGLTPQSVSSWLVRDTVTASTAAGVAELFDRLQLIPGSSSRTAGRAQRSGYAPSFAWDEDSIDDPTAQPDFGVFVPSTASERIQELHDLGIRDVYRIAERLGIKPASVERQLYPSRAAVIWDTGEESVA